MPALDLLIYSLIYYVFDLLKSEKQTTTTTISNSDIR